MTRTFPNLALGRTDLGPKDHPRTLGDPAGENRGPRYMVTLDQLHRGLGHLFRV